MGDALSRPFGWSVMLDKNIKLLPRSKIIKILCGHIIYIYMTTQYIYIVIDLSYLNQLQVTPLLIEAFFASRTIYYDKYNSSLLHQNVEYVINLLNNT